MTAPPRSRRRRAEAQLLRWQARLEGEAADRLLPYVIALLLFALWFGLALAREHGVGAGPDLAVALQQRWLILHGHAPVSTITDEHLLAQHLPLGFYLAAWATRVLPATPTLLGLQSLSLAAGVVPLWRMGRRLGELRVGAVLAIAGAYALSPTLNNLNAADFHTSTVAVAPLLGATYLALRERWRTFAVVSAVAVLWSAELGLIVAGLGILIWMRGHRTVGLRTLGLGFGWTLLAVVVLEPRYGSTGFVAPGAFSHYGHDFLTIGGGMVLHPVRLVGDLLAEGNVRLLVVLLAPLLFLPTLAPRFLLPAVPLQVLYLIADVNQRGVDVDLPLVVFAFVAATFALNRMGRKGVERVLVDRRVLLALVIASLGFFATESSTSPYRHPWEWARQDDVDHARREAARAIASDASVRAAAPTLTLLAQRLHVYELGHDDTAKAAAVGVDTVLVDDSGLGWSNSDDDRFAADITADGFTIVFRSHGITVFAKPRPGH